jgi:phenylacetic acid degradation operon negative regulatory protein
VAPRLSRRHATGSASARGLLFTVLGEFVLPGGGTAWTSAFVDVLARMGIEEKSARQALMRTAADGWLVADRVGRRTRWALSGSAERLLVDGARRIYGFTGVHADWDGSWLLVLARVPETERAARHVLRTRLTWAGLGSPSPGVWVSTHADRLAEIEDALAEAGDIGGHVFLGRHAGHGDLSALVRQAWDLPAVEQRYVEFVRRLDQPRPDDPLTAVVQLVHDWRRFPWLDPALPQSLLPAPWPGVTAAERFADLHARLVDDARPQWDDLNAG